MQFTGEFLIPGHSEARIEEDHLARYRFAQRFVSGKDVIDVACGVGYAAPMMTEAGARSYHGIDIKPELVNHATETYGSDIATYSNGDVTALDLENTADVILSFETIEHVAAYPKALSCLFAALRPGGTLLVSSPNRPITSPKAKLLTDQPVNPFHTQEFTPSELLAAVQAAGFEASEDDVYGQRLRRVWRRPFSKILGIYRDIFGQPDRTASPEVTPLKGKTPRYHLIVAHKP